MCLPLLVVALPPPPFLQPPPPRSPPNVPPPPYVPPPPFPPDASPPPHPIYPPQAAFGDVYGGYDNLADLLEELRNYGVDFDPEACSSWESLLYLSWMVVSLALTIAGRWLSKHSPARSLLFRVLVARPSNLYAMTMASITGLCMTNGKTQEWRFSFALIIIEPFLLGYVLWLIRDAGRNGISAHTIDVPLGRTQWRWLFFSVGFHLFIFVFAFLLMINAEGSGRLLLAAQASFTLRAVRPRPTVAPPGELQMYAYVMIGAVFLAVIGHFSVKRRARDALGAWSLAATGPIAMTALICGISLLTCIDTATSQQKFFFPALAASSGAALLACLWRAAGFESSVRPTRWIFVAMTLYHLTATIACIVCILSTEPMMVARFELPATEEEPASARYSLFLAPVVCLLIAVWSILMNDLDESLAWKPDAAAYARKLDDLLKGQLGGLKRRNRGPPTCRQRLFAAARSVAHTPSRAASRSAACLLNVASRARARARASYWKWTGQEARRVRQEQEAAKAKAEQHARVIQVAIEAAASGVGLLPTDEQQAAAAATPAPKKHAERVAAAAAAAATAAAAAAATAAAAEAAEAPAAAQSKGYALKTAPPAVVAIIARVSAAHHAEAEAMRRYSAEELRQLSAGGFDHTDDPEFIDRVNHRCAIESAEKMVGSKSSKCDEFTSFRSHSIARAKSKRSATSQHDPMIQTRSLRESRKPPESSFVKCDTKSATSTACTFDAAAARLAQGSSIALHTSTGDQLI